MNQRDRGQQPQPQQFPAACYRMVVFQGEERVRDLAGGLGDVPRRLDRYREREGVDQIVVFQMEHVGGGKYQFDPSSKLIHEVKVQDTWKDLIHPH